MDEGPTRQILQIGPACRWQLAIQRRARTRRRACATLAPRTTNRGLESGIGDWGLGIGDWGLPAYHPSYLCHQRAALRAPPTETNYPFEFEWGRTRSGSDTLTVRVAQSSPELFDCARLLDPLEYFHTSPTNIKSNQPIVVATCPYVSYFMSSMWFPSFIPTFAWTLLSIPFSCVDSVFFYLLMFDRSILLDIYTL